MVGSVKEASDVQYTPQPLFLTALAVPCQRGRPISSPGASSGFCHTPTRRMETWLKTQCVSVILCMLHCILKALLFSCGWAVAPCTGLFSAQKRCCSALASLLSFLLWVLCRSASASSPSQPGCPYPSKHWFFWHFPVSSRMSLSVLPEPPPTANCPSLDISFLGLATFFILKTPCHNTVLFQRTLGTVAE